MKESLEKAKPSPSRRRNPQPQTLAPVTFKLCRSNRSASASASAAAAAAAADDDGALDLSGLREVLPPLAGEARPLRHPPQVRFGPRRRKFYPADVHDADADAALRLSRFRRGQRLFHMLFVHALAEQVFRARYGGEAGAAAAGKREVVDESPGSGVGEAPIPRGDIEGWLGMLLDALRRIPSPDALPPQLSGEKRTGGDRMEE